MDVTTGAATAIGTGLGIDLIYAQDMDYDHNNGVLYLAGYLGGGASHLYTVDVSTGLVSAPLGDFPGAEICAFAVPYTPEDTYTVTFNVDDGIDPIENAEVVIDGQTLYTNASGVATIELADDAYPYTVDFGTCDQYTEIVTVAGAAVAEDVSMTCPTGIDEQIGQGISIFPNPSTGVFNVNVENNFNLEVLDITGKVINTQVISGNSTVEINSAGVYFFRFSNENSSVTQRVIVQ